MRPLKVLFFLYPMRYGGIEIWVRDIIRHTPRSRLAVDLWVLGEEEVLDKELKERGVHMTHYKRLPPNPLTMIVSVWRALSRTRYDAVHCHYRHINGLFLLFAALKGVPVRVAHSHNDMRRYDVQKSFFEKAYMAFMRFLTHLFATHDLAASDDAARSLFGENYRKDPRWRVFFCGLDLSGFRQPPRPEIREELGLPPAGQGLVIGHVGRMTEQKNHRFILDIFAAVLEKEKDARLLLVGDGSLRAEMEAYADRLGIRDHVVFAGRHSDVPTVLKSACDVFLFPSLFEGLGLAAVEAQAAGLPCVMADLIPAEADVVAGLVTRLSLDREPAVWADALIEAAATPAGIRQKGLEIVERSAFNFENGIGELVVLYEGKMPGG